MANSEQSHWNSHYIAVTISELVSKLPRGLKDSKRANMSVRNPLKRVLMTAEKESCFRGRANCKCSNTYHGTNVDFMLTLKKLRFKPTIFW